MSQYPLLPHKYNRNEDFSMTREEMMDNLGNNLEKERIALHFSQSQMAEALDMSLSSYKRIISGETNRIDFYTIYLMYKLTNKFSYELCGIPIPELETCNALQRLSPSQQRFINGVIDFEKEFSQDLNDNESADDYVTMIIPSGDMQDGMIYDSCSLEKINVSTYQKRYNGIIDCAIKITTNHLHPVYYLNDILLISRQPIRDGDTGVFINKATGLAYIRRFRQTNPCRLEPICHYGTPFLIDSNNAAEMSHWIKFGYVVTKIRF